MMRKILMLVFLAMVGSRVFAMEPPLSPRTPRASQAQSTVLSPVSSNDLGSPGESRMRGSVRTRRLFQSSAVTELNPVIFELLPRPNFTPPNLNVPTDQIVNDWFFNHITDDQKMVLNKIAYAFDQGKKASLSKQEFSLFAQFPDWIHRKLAHHIHYVSTASDDEELEETEVQVNSPQSQGDTLSKRRRK